jgi:hypothetical protein
VQNDKRLIDANALLKEIEHWHDSLGGTMNPADWGIQNVLQSVMDHINEAEDIDAVPVVRCWECVLRGSDYCPMCHDEYTYDEDDGGDYYTVDNTDDDGFCHIGKREV